VTTVTPPVTATASTGIEPRPVAWKVRAVPRGKAPARPLPERESRTRTVSIGKYVLPAALLTK
jgi:hypothetical protein